MEYRVHPPRERSLIVLLIDDDEEEAYILQRMFAEMAGVDVELRHFTVSEMALLDLLTETADVVILDHHLGGGQTGLDILRNLRESGFDTPVIMLTGRDEEELVAKFQRFGADAYVCKSEIDVGQIAVAIEVALTKPHALTPRIIPE